MRNVILVGDVREKMREIPDETVQCVVTSPPYWGLRDYGAEGQIGLEPTPEAYVEDMVAVFREVWRVLRKDGTVWLNLGDSYASAWSAGSRRSIVGQTIPPPKETRGRISEGLKEKDLVGIPWRVAFALQADGWWLRSDIIWSKPNPMPESVTDRPTKSHEYVFLLTKSERYFYDQNAIRTAPKWPEPMSMRIARAEWGHKASPTAEKNGIRPRTTDKQRGHSKRHAGFNDRWDSMTKEEQAAGDANARTVWEIVTQPYSEAHFATFPEALAKRCILAGSKEGDVILDPFLGSGTTALVAKRAGRDYIGIELNPEYVKLAEERIGVRQERML